jgi:lipopolysaccharide transport system permease protein
VRDDQNWVENRPRRGFIHLDFAEVWDYRELAWFMALRDLKVRYKQAAFGIGWAVVQPLAMVAAFTLVFRRLASVSSDGIPYPVFALVGLMAWGYVSGSVVRATQSLVGNAALVTKVYFPRILVPAAAVLPGAVDFMLALPVLAVLMVIYSVSPTWAIVTLPLWLLALVILAFAVGLLLSALNVRYRDVNQAIALMIQLWLFLSPVAYPASSVPGHWRTLYYLNPMAGIVTGLRWAVVGGAGLEPAVLLSGVSASLVLAGAIWYFQRTERRFADIM